MKNFKNVCTKPKRMVCQKEGAKLFQPFSECPIVYSTCKWNAAVQQTSLWGKLASKDSQTLVKVKAWHYVADQRAILGRSLDQLGKYSMLISDDTVRWQTGLHAIFNSSLKSKYWITIDLRSVNAATKAEAWPTTSSDSELMEFSESKNFSSLDFPTVCCLILLGDSFYYGYNLAAMQEVLRVTMGFQDFKNTAAHFQAIVPIWFPNVQHASKLWLDGLVANGKTENAWSTALISSWQYSENNIWNYAASNSIFQEGYQVEVVHSKFQRIQSASKKYGGNMAHQHTSNHRKICSN